MFFILSQKTLIFTFYRLFFIGSNIRRIHYFTDAVLYRAFLLYIICIISDFSSLIMCFSSRLM